MNICPQASPCVTTTVKGGPSNNKVAEGIWNTVEERAHRRCAKDHGIVVVGGDLNVSMTARDKGGRKWSFPASAVNTVDKIEGLLMADTHAVAHPPTAEHTHHANNLNVRDATLDCVLTSDSRPGIVQGASVDRFPIDVKMLDHAPPFARR